MRKSLVKSIGQNRRAILMLGTILSLALFSIVAWRANAGNGSDRRVPGDKQLMTEGTSDKSDKKGEKPVNSGLETDDPTLILLNSGAINTASDEALAANNKFERFSGKQMRLVKFGGPIQPEWYSMLQKTGVEIVDYIPNFSYLVYGDPDGIGRLQATALKTDTPIQWNAEYTSRERIDPGVYQRQSRQRAGAASKPDDNYFNVQLFKDDITNEETLGRIATLQIAPQKVKAEYLHYVNVTVALSLDGMEEIGKRPDVISIQPYLEPVKLDERQDIIMTGNLTGNGPTPMNYLTYLVNNGIDPSVVSSFAVNLSDSGVDNATTTPNHFALYKNGDPSLAANSRFIFSRLIGTPHAGSTTQGCDGHGNENSHIIGGYVPTGTVGGVNFGAFPHADAAGFRWDVGLAPFVKVGSSVIFDPATFTSPVYQNLESQAYNDGARISSNSWGSASNAYTVDSQQYDALVRDAQPDTACVAPNCISTVGNQEYVIVFSAGNNGSGANTVGSPSTGKNVISVGAAENVNPFGGADACAVADVGADNANDIISFSSRGPTSDGRKKPDIVAPGTHVSAGVAQATLVSPAGSGTGAQLACFDGSGVCGGTGGSNFFPAGQQWYTASSGTSHSAPAVSGVAALIRQKFINLALAPPSPALTKGLILNSGRYMNGVGANDTLPSNSQGMGEVNLNSFFDILTTPHTFHDEVPAETFTATGQQRVITGTVSNNAKPFRVTLVWTDAPGPTSGNAFVNNLDLEVTAGGSTYKGNVFTGASSSTGGTADARNNVESVVIPAGVTGNFVIKVKATNIAGNGVPNNPQPLDQDFALVVYNATEAPLPVISTGATAITAESCAAPNNAIDPAETVTINFDLANVGTANTANLVATLLPTGGVTAPSGPQTYGAMTANGPAVTRPFTFTSGATCGQTLTATFQLQDGASNLGTVSFPFTVGVPSLTTENFDAVAAPALPAGWVATNATGAAPLWVTSNSTPDTAPNTLFIDDPASASDKRIESPTFTIVTPAAQVSFRNNFTLESTFDGGVLEVSSPNINAGAYTDVTNVAVGGSFVTGGYSGAISAASSAINGRQAWTGTSGGYIDTVANLGPNVVGQGIKLRLRMSSDSSVSATGWRVDTFRVLTGFACCGVAGTPIVISGGNATVTAENFNPPNNTPDPGETVTANFPLKNTGTGNTTNLVATLLNSGGVAPVTASQNYGALVAGGATVTRPFTFVASGACGGTITATLHLQDGVLDLGNVTYTFQLGTTNTSTSFTQNFDGVAAPALPAGWTSTVTVGALPPWVTSTTTPDTPLNDAFGSEIATVSNTELVSPAISIPAGGGQLTFRNLYNMESTFDGMVLEVSVNGGAFADIIAAGGSFVVGGYNSTISSNFSSPILGRPAWSGLSGGTTAAPAYITTTVNLPPAANGQSIALKWRDATDTSAVAAGVPGVRIDSISISTSTPVCAIAGPNCDQNFDTGVVVPALPLGWKSTATGAEVPWVTSATTPDSGTNDAFAPDVSSVGDTELLSTTFIIAPGGSQVTFRNLFNMENNSDGMVLEINIAGNPYQDILTAGGSFVTGGYNGTIAAGSGSPIAGRLAWTGLSGGSTAAPAYITTTVNLPATANGQVIHLKWRVATNNSGVAPGTAGVRIDTVTGISCTATAAGVEVAGRVLTADGNGLMNARVVMTDTEGTSRIVTTSSFGYFRFEDVTAGGTYVVSVQSKRYRFASRIVQVSDSLGNVDFVAEP